jgi:hypothetical protein
MGEAGRGDQSVLLYMVKEQDLRFKEIYSALRNNLCMLHIPWSLLLAVRFLGNMAPPSPPSVWMKGLLYVKHRLSLQHKEN